MKDPCKNVHWMNATPQVSITLTADGNNSGSVSICAGWLRHAGSPDAFQLLKADATPSGSDCDTVPPGQMRRPTPGPTPDDARSLRVEVGFKNATDSATLTVSQGGKILGKADLKGCAEVLWSFSVIR